LGRGLAPPSCRTCSAHMNYLAASREVSTEPVGCRQNNRSCCVWSLEYSPWRPWRAM
jgi:hypothetical protein